RPAKAAAPATTDSTKRLAPAPSAKPALSPAPGTKPLAPAPSAQPAAATTTTPTDTAQRTIIGWRKRPYERMTRDMTLWENSPNFAGTFKDAPIRTNQWGMRDK